MQACQDAGAEFARVALNVGLGTFQPLIDETVEQNHLHQETWEIPAAAAEILAHAKRRVAVGTTSVRTLEIPYLFFAGLSEKAFPAAGHDDPERRICSSTRASSSRPPMSC